MAETFSVASEKHIEKQMKQFKVDSLDMLPKETRRQILKDARTIARNDVFGVGHKLGKEGPEEQGLGSWDNPTQQSIDAYIKNQTERRPAGPEPDFESNVRKMRARLAEVDAQRRKLKVATDEDEDF
jgi:hypothetical protein